MDSIKTFFAQNGILIVSFLEILLIKLGLFLFFVLIVEALSRFLKKKNYISFDVEWTFKNVIQIFLFYIGFQALTVFLKGGIEEADLEGLAVFWAITEYLFLLCLILFFVYTVFGSNSKKLGFVFTDLKKDLRVTVSILVYLLLACALVNIIYYYEILPPSTRIIHRVGFREFFGGGLFTHMKYLLIFVISPVTEEVFYRGLMYPVVRNKIGPVLTMITLSLFFTSVHFDPQFFILIFLLSCTLCYIYEKRRSLVSPIIVHAAYNLAVTLGWFSY